MKMIWLTRGQFTLVDDEHYQYLSQWKWSAAKVSNSDIFYACRTDSDKKRIYMHRDIMKDVLSSSLVVDHKDRNGLNNLSDNLRVCTKSQNQCNAKSRKNSVSIHKGVGYFSRDAKWRAYIQINGKAKHIGLFETEKEAAIAYNKVAVELHGEFAKLNDVI